MDRRGITGDLSPVERMEKLHGLFTILAASTHAISDNLQPGELQRRLNGNVHLTDMAILLDENEHAVELLHDCVEEMRRCPLSQVNGTSLAFSECNRIYKEEAQRLETGRVELAGLLHRGTTDKTSDWKPAMACLVMHISSFFLVFEDMITA